MSFGFPYLKNELSDLHCIHVYDSEGLDILKYRTLLGLGRCLMAMCLPCKPVDLNLIFRTQVKVLPDDLTGNPMAGEAETDRSLGCTA